MILTQVKTYLAARGRASLDDLAMHFAMDADAMRGLLGTWVAKGRARRVNQAVPCGTCGKCESATAEIYEWLDAGAHTPTSRVCGH
jgi:hypothetical protein